MGGPLSSKPVSQCFSGKNRGGEFISATRVVRDSMSRAHGRTTCIYAHLLHQDYVAQIIVHNDIYYLHCFAHWFSMFVLSCVGRALSLVQV